MKKLFFLLTTFALVLSCSSDETSTPVTPLPAPIVKYTITLSAGEGGTVSTTGGEYEAGQTVSVTATPQGEYVFTSWSDGNTNATRTITVSSNSTLTANFEKRKYPLTINIEGEGEVLEEIVNAGRTTDYDSGTTIRLTAIPNSNENWEFIGWVGDIESTDSIIEIEISKAKSVEAKFMRYFNYNKPSYYLETPEDIWIDYYDLLMEKNGYDMGKYAVGYPEVYADFDFDGYVDVMFAPSLYENQGGYGDVELWFFKNTGNNIDFTQEKLSIDPHLGTFNAAQAILGDFNGDNKPDVVYSEAGRDIYLGPGTTPTMLLSTQDGYLMKDITNTSVSYGGGASGDIDNDGDLDVILGGLDALTIFYNDGNGNFEEKIQYADEALNLNPVNDIIELVEIENPSGGSFLNLKLIDINNDGFMDMIGGYDKFRRINTIYYGNGVDFSKDRITVLPYTNEWDALHNINFYDIDGDGELEIIAGRSTGNGFEGFYLEAYKKVGDEYVILENIFDNSSARDIRWIMQMSISDIDNNGKIDIYCRDKGHLGYGEYRWEWNGTRFEKRF